MGELTTEGAVRIGVNPQKDRERGGTQCWHRVVTPVYIPEDVGFFEHSAEVLQAVLASILRTTGPETGITVVVNAASERSRRVLEAAVRQSSRMDVIWRAQNAGKVEALFSAARGYHEPLVTLTDSDVFFLPGWLEKTVEVFDAFPRAGVVSALPVPHLRRQCTTATWFGAAIRGMLQRKPLARREDMVEYMNDLGSPNLIREDQLKAQWGVESRGVWALIGATHMQCTMRREVVEAAPREECRVAMGRESECRWIDEPADVLGYWRLSLPQAYVRHLGNHCPAEIYGFLGEASVIEVEAPRRSIRGGESWIPYPLRSLAGRAVNRLCEAWAAQQRRTE